MPGQTVLAANTLTAGILSTFRDTYRNKRKTADARLTNVMQQDLPSDKETELYAFFNSAAHPVRQPKGQAVSSKPFDSVTFSVQNFKYSRQIEWFEEDREDDQTDSLMSQARSMGENFAHLNERIFFQIIQEATDLDLLPAIPNAPDGAAIYSLLDGAGNVRFGRTGGNLNAGTGVASSAAIRTDFWNAIEAFREFQDTESEPLWDEATLEGGYTVIYGAANEEAFREAFQQTRTLDGGAALTNIIMESGTKVKLWSTQRITDNDWYVFMDGSPIKAVFHQKRRATRGLDRTHQNSDTARNLDIEAVKFDLRAGFSVNTVYQTVKVNN